MESFNFQTIGEVCDYVEMTRTEQAKHYANTIKKYVKAYGFKITEYYIYNKDIKLWLNVNDTKYDGYVCEFFNNSIKKIKALLCNIQDDRIKTLIKNFDNKAYMTDISNRALHYLYDEEFVSKLNSDSEYLPIENGQKINLKTLEITERTENDKFTFECKVQYKNETPNADIYFTNLFPNKEEREYVRKVLGYMLTGDTKARCFFVFYGVGKNGKTKIATILDTILKEFYHQCAEEVFKKKSNVGGASPELFSLMGKRIAVYSESETGDNMNLNFSNLKMISGEDKINARGLFKDPVNFYTFAKLLLLTNYTPPLSADRPIKDRLRYIYFDQRFEDTDINNIEFVEKFTKGEYLNEAFSWIAKGAKEYYKTCQIAMPESYQKRTKKLLEDVDSIETFLTRIMIKTNKSSDYIRKKVLFDNYKEFCDLNSQRCQPRSTLYNRLDHMNIPTSILDGYDVYRGIKVKKLKEDDYMFTDDLDNGVQPIKTNLEEENKKLKEELEILKNEIKELKKQNTPIKSMSSNVRKCHDKTIKIIKEFTKEIDNNRCLLDNTQEQYDNLMKSRVPSEQTVKPNNDSINTTFAQLLD